MRVLEKDKVEVEKGDMVCLYTGFADVMLELKKKPDPKLLHDTCSGLDGRDEKLLQWITDSRPRLPDRRQLRGGADPGRASPSRRRTRSMPLHEHCLFKNGIHLGEMWYLTELARWLREHKRNRFLLTAPPLRLPGAVGSPADADRHGMKVAIVTGGTSGMGEATAKELAKRGWQVAHVPKNAARIAQGILSQGDVARGRRLPPRGEGGARQVGPHRRAGEQRRHHQVRRRTPTSKACRPTTSSASSASTSSAPSR